MTVTECEREFVRLSKYARECVSTKAIMCKWFEDGLNEDIKLLVGILELKEFLVLVERACKVEELSKEKRKVEFESRDSRKRFIRKSHKSTSKKSKEHHYRPTVFAGHFSQVRDARYSSSKPQVTSVASVGSVRNARPEYKHCDRPYYDECRVKRGACFRCGSFNHYLKDYPKKSEKEKAQTLRPINTASRRRPPRNTGNMSGSRGATRHIAERSEARALARAYAIRARKDTSVPDVIIGIFSLYNTNVTALIDLGSTHSYVCTKLVSSKSLPVKSTELVVKVSNPLGQYVLVDKVCKNCPLMTRGYSFPADLMLLPFNVFDVILGMDWLTLHDAVNGEILLIEYVDLSGLPVAISTMLAQKYVKKGCEAYLAYVLDIKVSEPKIESVLVVCEYLDVFLEGLFGLPLIKEVEFAIELVPGLSPISIAPYRMAPTELKELKVQLQELTDRGFA
ncbi:Gag-Pol polyprotein [Gossypium australe]|uniref:Gag-Pol polyprotein n=1 Tax=Gossypium australe TaxID=47621 RepID=A0A5B6UZK1_9ROSI|nr:Gag-Pol polyprotein [Gossypium australe]